MMGLSWWLGRRYAEVDTDVSPPELQVECPGTLLDGVVVPYEPPGAHMRAYCYREFEGDVLVGTRTRLAPAPVDWLPLDLQAARAHYELVLGEPPTSSQVF